MLDIYWLSGESDIDITIARFVVGYKGIGQGENALSSRCLLDEQMFRAANISHDVHSPPMIASLPEILILDDGLYMDQICGQSREYFPKPPGCIP